MIWAIALRAPSPLGKARAVFHRLGPAGECQLSREDAKMTDFERLMALLQNPSKEMLDAGMSAAEDCKDSSWDSGCDGESYNSYEYYTSDAPAVIFKAMVAV